MLSEKSVRRLTPTTTTPPLAGFSSLEMAIDAMERRANASTVSASTPRSLGIPAFRLRVCSARRLCLAMLPLFFDFPLEARWWMTNRITLNSSAMY